MPRLPKLTGEELVSALKKAGFEVARQRGSHVQLRKWTEGEKVTFPVPVHVGKTIKPGTLRGILRIAGLTVEQLRELL